MPYDSVTLKTYRNEILVLVAPCLAKYRNFSIFDILRYFCQMNTNRFQIFITVRSEGGSIIWHKKSFLESCTLPPYQYKSIQNCIIIFIFKGDYIITIFCNQ
jgi:hypothetical protein